MKVLGFWVSGSRRSIQNPSGATIDLGRSLGLKFTLCFESYRSRVILKRALRITPILAVAQVLQIWQNCG
jgi:hypothetical protein